jgi:hypothetical protein
LGASGNIIDRPYVGIAADGIFANDHYLQLVASGARGKTSPEQGTPSCI